MLQPPLASEFDPAESDETSIDPLGLATTYERLADQMLGNVTVRMTRIRLVTAIAVGAVVAETWDDGEVAKDEVSTADMVFEWLTLIAFVRPGRGGAEERLRRVGGMQKVKRALLAGNPISAKTYLKTPRVFGFSGVFRRFAEGIFDLEDVAKRAHELSAFVAAAALQYEFDARNVYALGYSNGANIAVASLLVAPTTFKGAMLWRAQLTLVPEPPLSLAGKPILLSAGRYDPLIRVDQSEALYEQLRSQGAATSLAWQESQHGLVQSDIEMTAGWFRALIS